MTNKDIANFVDINKEKRVAFGKQREIYEIREHPNCLVKVLGEGKKYARYRLSKRLIHKLFPNYTNRYIFRELQHELKVQTLAAQLGISSPIGPIRGLVRTERGLGQLVQRIGPKKGGMGQTLITFAGDGKLDDEALENLNTFATSCFQLKVVVNDLHASNIVYGEVNGTYRPFLIDGYGDRNFIPTKSLLSWKRNKSLNEGFAICARSAGLKWSSKNRKFTRL